MSDPRRYQSRRPSKQPSLWPRLLAVAVLGMIVVVASRAFFMSDENETSPRSQEPTITLVNDVVNMDVNATVIPETANANTSLNANVSVNANTSTAKITTTQCQTALSRFSNGQRVALTFDLAANNENVQSLVTVLTEAGVSATFSPTGTFAAKHPALIASLGQSFELGNHGYDVKSYKDMTAAQVTDQLTRTSAAISTAGGGEQPFFRPPYGESSDVLVKTARDKGYCTTLWTVDAFDWQQNQTVEAATERVLAKLQAGSILLFHAGYDITAETVRGVLAEAKTKGLEVGSLSQLLSTSTP